MRFTVKRIKSILTTFKFLGFPGYLMNTESIAPWRGFTKKIFLTFLSCPFRASYLSVNHRKSTSLCFVLQPHHRDHPMSNTGYFWLEIDEWGINSLLLHSPSFLLSLLPTSKMSTLREHVSLFQLNVYLLSISSWDKLWHFYQPRVKVKNCISQNGIKADFLPF